MRGVSERLDRVDKQPIGRTTIDLQAYLQHVTGTTRGGLTADISRRFTGHLSGFANAQLGVVRSSGNISMEALATIGLRGYF